MSLWGPLELTEDAGIGLRFGPLSVQLWLRSGRVLLAEQRDQPDALERQPLAEPPADPRAVVLPESPVVVRPVLPDRALVARPAMALELPPHTGCTVFVRVPVWMAVTGLGEFAPVVPKQTWFGGSMVDGELAYAAHTRLRHNLADVPSDTWRATTEVRIRNEADTPLNVARVRLPLPRLALYAGFQTQGIELVREADNELATPRILPVEGERLAEPRQVAVSGAQRAFNALLPGWGP